MKTSLELVDKEHIDLFQGLPNPFPGLRPFSIEESHLFFGREGQNDEVLMKLARNKFTAIIGASGSGKSSFMFCGVIPILYGGFLANAQSNWDVIVTRPGAGPIDNLADALICKNPDFIVSDTDDKQIRKTIVSTLLRSSSLGIVEAVKQLGLTRNQNVLLIVDQFEELFRFKKGEDFSKGMNESLAFVNLLLEAVQSSEVPIYVAITMRSEFIGDCAQFPDLTKFINDSHYLIPQMVREQKRLAIEGPVAVGGGAISSRLVQQLLNDLGDNPDQLPILQHALMRTWNYWQENKDSTSFIDVSHYQAIGGMEGALSQHADEAYDELNDSEKDVCASMFKALTEKGMDSQGVRRPTKISVIAAISNANVDVVISVVNHFRKEGRSLLMPSPSVELTKDTIVDISHESLMRIWTRLKKWVEEESESVQMYQRLSEGASMYQIGKSGLWRPPDLHLGLNWFDKSKPTLVWAQRYDNAFERTIVFLNSSQEQYDEELRIKELMQKKVLKRARTVALVLGIAAIISLGFLVYSYVQKQEAMKQKAIAESNEEEAITQKQEADRQKNIAFSSEKKALEQKEIANGQRLIAEEQTGIANNQRTLAEKNAIEADRQKNIAVTSEKEAVFQKKVADEQRGLAEQNADKAYRLRLLSIAQSMAVKSAQMDEDTMRKALLAQQAYKYHTKNGGKQHNHDIYDGLYYALKTLKPNDYNSLKGHRDAVRSIVYSNDGKTIYTSGSDGKVLQWNKAEGVEKPVLLMQNTSLNRAMEISLDNKFIAIAGDQSSIKIIKLSETTSLSIKLNGHKGIVLGFSFAPNGNLISFATDSTVMAWDITTMKFEVLYKAKTKVKSIAVNKTNGVVAVGLDIGQVVLIQNTQVSVLADYPGKSVHSLAFSNNGNWLAMGDQHGMVHIWDVNTKKHMQALPGQKARINDLEFSKDDRFMASASFDASVRVYEMDELNEQPLVLKDHNYWVWSLAFSPDGNTLIAGCVDNLVRIWPTNTASMSSQICSNLKRNMSKKEWQRYAAKDIPYESTCPELSSGEAIKED